MGKESKGEKTTNLTQGVDDEPSAIGYQPRKNVFRRLPPDGRLRLRTGQAIRAEHRALRSRKRLSRQHFAQYLAGNCPNSRTRNLRIPNFRTATAARV